MAVLYSADTFVVNQSLVLRINICVVNRHLRQARNRWTEMAAWQAHFNQRFQPAAATETRPHASDFGSLNSVQRIRA